MINILVRDGIPVAYLDGDRSYRELAKHLSDYFYSIRPALEQKCGGPVVTDKKYVAGGYPKLVVRYGARPISVCVWHLVAPLEVAAPDAAATQR